MNTHNPLVLVILDGFGHTDATQYNAIAHARIPHITEWLARYPCAYINARGHAVGLLPGAVGNSEVGHLTIGAGRIIPQPALIIHEAICNAIFDKNSRLQDALQRVKKNNGRLHVMGLVSDAGIHSTLELMQASIMAAVQAGIRQIVVHPILDGRDEVVRSAVQYLNALQTTISPYSNVIIGSIHGRFYAMDRDHNWDRVEQSYRVLTERVALTFSDWRSVIQFYYSQNITDEFIPPTQLSTDAVIQDGDGILFTNYRSDRARELSACFVHRDQVPFATMPLELSCFITPVNYDAHEHTTVLFDRPLIKNTLKDVLAQHGKRIVSVAETEKYAHVTYFFNGEIEQPVRGEERILVPSIHAKNYVDQPCMSAPQITQKVLASLQHDPADFYLINYANADMVGHSGNFEATVKAVECLDEQLAILYMSVVEKMNGTLIITADHGNAETMFDEKTGQPYTGHTANKVPFLVISSGMKLQKEALPTQLSEIAPFILNYMGLPVPDEMKKK